MEEKLEKLNEERQIQWEKAKLLLDELNNNRVSDNKYKNNRLIINDIKYDSEREYYRHLELLLLEKYGFISNLKFHAPEDVIFVVTDPNVKYIPDFSYIENGKKIVEDVKGMQTPDFIIKKKIVISKIRTGEFDFELRLTRKLKNGFISFEFYNKEESYVKPKRKRKKKAKTTKKENKE